MVSGTAIPELYNRPQDIHEIKPMEKVITPKYNFFSREYIIAENPIDEKNNTDTIKCREPYISLKVATS